MAWLYLLLAGLLEVAWAVGMKWAVKHDRYWPILLVFLLSIGSFVLLTQAMKSLGLGTSYAVWTGIGAIGAAICGVLIYKESVDPWRILFMVVIIVGIVGLKWTSTS
jgi:quaternary ammonium compound-resistance protein SugE